MPHRLIAVARRLAAPFLLLMLALLPLPDYWITQLNYIGLYSLVCLGLVLLTGVAGLTSFGQAAFVGIGAYTSAWLTLNLGLSPWLTLFGGLALTALSALLLGAITLRMSGHYLALATIAWGLSLFYLMGNLDALGKYDGLTGLPGLSVAGFALGQGRGFFVLTWCVVLAAASGMLQLLDSRAGRAMRALRQGPLMAEAMGVNTLRYKVVIFVLAALLAALSGWLFAHFQRSINPSPFGLRMGIEYLFMAVVGGIGQVGGAIVGALLTKLMEDQLQVVLPRLLGASGSYEVIVFGILLVCMLRFLPDGLWSLVQRRWPRPPRRMDWQDAPALPVRVRPQPGEKVLEVQDISKRFGGLLAVNGIGFEIRAGQMVGLIGPNGAGKSTTFNLLSGVLPLTGGSVRLRGERIDGLPARAIAARGLSRTFQHVRMIADMTVLENVALGGHLRGHRGVLSAILGRHRAEERQLLREAAFQLERVGLAQYLHVPAGHLPMGPQRLMEIARALCSDPALLLLDEPAAGLRHQEKQALATVLRQLRREGLSILLVEHDMGLVMELCDHLVVMEFGTLLTQGTPQAIQSSAAVRAAYLGTEHGAATP